MAIFFENPLPIVAVGAVLATVCGLAFLARRTLVSLLLLAGVVLLTLLLVLLEQLVVTERELVEAALYQLMDDIESGEVSAVLASIDSGAAKMRADVEKLMPEARIEDTGATAVRIEVDEASEPPTATSWFRGRLDGLHQRSGMRVFFFDEVEISWVKRGDRWQAVDYAVQWRGNSIDPVKSMKGNRPTPAIR